jgi:rhodanese-related sulfurtransferase
MIRSCRLPIGVVAIALLLAAPLACHREAAETSISQRELADRIGTRGAPLILDVRTRSEFESGHIPSAINIPHRELPRRVGELGVGSHREIVVYCEAGGRAMRAASELRRAGFSSVLHLQGDMSAWRKSPLPCEGC